MSIIVLGDMHIGARKSSPIFHSYFSKTYQWMFDHMEEHSIKHILQVGDMFDVRAYLSTYANEFVKTKFLNELKRRNIELLAIVGNHDCYYKEKTSLNTISEVLEPMNNPLFRVVTTPMDLTFGGYDFACFPWVCKETQSLTETLIENTTSKVAVGHFEFLGFEYHRGSLSTIGHRHTDYAKFDMVISGHYHTSSQRDNVIYTGTPYELTWVDYNDPKGFWVYDGAMKFHQNPNTMFHIWDYPTEVTEIEVKDKIHRIRVNSDVARTKDFLEYKSRLIDFSPAEDIKVIEVQNDQTEEVKTVIESTATTQMDYVTSYINSKSLSDADEVIAEIQDIFSELEQFHDIV
jgi:DNA repair exonuclease SbcCD nuclease subunit